MILQTPGGLNAKFPQLLQGIPVLLGCLLMNLLISSASSAQPSNHTKLLFLGNKNIAPVVYLDNGIPSGVAVDIVHALAKHMPQPVEIRVMDWSEAQALVAGGNADVLIQINPTEERKKIYDFSETLLESQFSIFITTNRGGITGLSSLRGLRVGVESGGLPQSVLRQDPRIQMRIIANFLEGFRLLDANALDAVVVDYRVGSYVLAENRIRNIKVTGTPIATSFSSFAVKKGNLHLLAEINTALRIIKADGTYQKILDKWEPKESIFFTRGLITRIISYITIVFFLILFLIAFTWMVTLKKELTKKKAAEERLREQYVTLRGIIDSANALIFSVDRQYRYTSFNLRHASAMKALYAAEIELGQSLLGYMTVPEDRETAKRNLDQALTGQQVVDEAYSGEEPRSRHFFQISHSPIKAMEEIIGVAVLAQDITERKKAEEKVLRSDQRLRLHSEQSPLGFLEWDDNFHAIEWNSACERIFGYTREEAIGRHAKDLILPVEVHELVDGIYHNLMSRTGGQHSINENVTKDGRTIICEWFNTTLINNAGKAIGVASVCRDITKQKRDEEALYRLNRELRAISSCNQALLRSEDEQSLLGDICRIICEEAGYRMAWVGYPENDDAGSIRPICWAGFEAGYLANAGITWADTEHGQGPAGRAIRDGVSACIQDFVTDTLAAPWKESALQRGYRSSSALPLKDENGVPFGILCIYSSEPGTFTPEELKLLDELAADLAFGITALRTRAARRQADQDLALLSFALDNVREAAFLIDEQAHFVYVNLEACRALGYSRDELLAKGVADIDPDFPMGRWPDHWREVASNRAMTFESRHQGKDGRILPVEINANYIEYGQKSYNLGLVRDITERKQAEQELILRERNYRTLLENLPDLIVRYDLDLRRTYVNPAWEKASGLSAAEVVGVMYTDIPKVPSPVNVDYVEKLRLALATGTSQVAEFTWTNAFGAELFLQYVIVPEFDQNEKIAGVLAVGRDITEHKQIERERLAHLSFLENMDKVNRTIQSADDLEKMMRDLLGAVLSIFNCDRAFLLHPCDPEAKTWFIPMECTKPEYPGVLKLGGEMPMGSQEAETLRILLAADGPVTFGLGMQHALPGGVISEQFGIKCFLSMAIYPKIGSPWQFGIHQCAYARTWTEEEIRLFQEIGRRLADGLSIMLVHRDLQYSMRKLEEAQYLAHIGSWEVDFRNNALTWSNEIYRMFEIDPRKSAASYETFSASIHPDDREAVNTAHARSAKDRTSCSIEYRLLFPDGRTKYVHEQCETFHENDKPIRSAGTIQDITERKRTEAEVEHLKNYLANIIESMPSILVGMDCDECITQWNKKAEESTGISPAEALGRPVSHLLSDFTPWIDAMQSEIQQRRAASMEKLLIEKEGERRFFDLMLYPLITNGVEGAVLRIEDVTERTRIQELMVQTEKMMSLGGLAAGMAHEINNPLGIISQAAQNIERRVSLELPANRQAAEELGVSLEGINAYFEQRQILEFVGSIRTASLRAAKIVANMLQFSRRAETTMQPASLSGIMDQAVELAGSDYDLKKNYDFRSIDIVRDYAQDVPPVPVVSVEIEQVVLNLLKNAAQAMHLTSPDRRPRITLHLRCEARYALMEIEDNGPGMAEDIRRRVFEPFFTTKEPGIGTGLGLSVSYMIVTQNHKGLMEVESTPGRGACFRVRLPLDKRELL